jgi:site-specific DNA recombinase
MLADRTAIALALEESGVESGRLVAALKSAAAWVARLQSNGESLSALAELVGRVELSREGVRLSLKLPLPPTDANGGGVDHLALNKFVPTQMKRRGVELRLVPEGDATPSRVNLPLLKAIARARSWSQDLVSGQVKSVGELAKREGLDRRSVRRLIWLGFLSPRIVEAIAEGRQSPDLTVIGLTRRIDLPLLWSAQESALSIR